MMHTHTDLNTPMNEDWIGSEAAAPVLFTAELPVCRVGFSSINVHSLSSEWLPVRWGNTSLVGQKKHKTERWRRIQEWQWKENEEIRVKRQNNDNHDELWKQRLKDMVVCGGHRGQLCNDLISRQDTVTWGLICVWLWMFPFPGDCVHNNNNNNNFCCRNNTFLQQISKPMPQQTFNLSRSKASDYNQDSFRCSFFLTELMRIRTKHLLICAFIQQTDMFSL